MALESKSKKILEHPVNNLKLGVAEVFDPSEQAAYLEFRLQKYVAEPQSGEALAPSGLPKVYAAGELPVWNPRTLKENRVEAHKACLRKAIDYYFPLYPGEEVREDSFSLLSEPFRSAETGSPIMLRTTNKATMYAIARDWKISLADRTLAYAPSVPAFAYMSLQAKGPDMAGAVTKVVTCFADGFKGDYVKLGIDLISLALGFASESGPTWADQLAMIRQVVREELISNDLEKINADFSSLKDWTDNTYLPIKRSAPQNVTRLQPLLADQLSPRGPVLSNLNLLLEEKHRIPGFSLLMIGVPLYLALLQEAINLGLQEDIGRAGREWADRMLKAWTGLKKYRKDNITIRKLNYGVYIAGDVDTEYYYRWDDKVDGSSEGGRNGPFQVSKNDDGKTKCQAAADRHYNMVVNNMICDFANPDATAESWRKLGAKSAVV